MKVRGSLSKNIKTETKITHEFTEPKRLKVERYPSPTLVKIYLQHAL